MAGYPVVQAAHQVADVTLTTTDETLVLSSGPLPVPYETARFLILAMCKVTSGAAVTALTGRIRRGALLTGTLVSAADAVQLAVAAGSTEYCFAWAIEQRGPVGNQEYAFTVQQTGGAANATVVDAMIVVIAL